MLRQLDRGASKSRVQLPEPEKRNRVHQSSKQSIGRNELQFWTAAINQSLYIAWQKIERQLIIIMSFLVTALWYCRRLYAYLAQLLKWWSRYLHRKFKKNLSVLAEVDLLGYCAREWKGETKQAKQMKAAYKELFWRHHVKYIRPVRRDNYSALRAVLFQIFSQGIYFPPWMRERDILKLPEKLLYSQGCNWIQQYSFGPERYTGPNVFGKLRKCIETLKTQVELFLLGYLLEVKIRVYRLYKFNTEEFQVSYPEEYHRDWQEISLLTEDDHHYHIPIIRIRD
ncbi:inactive ubiquitin thioesterase OTULINL isoform X4 [Pelodiscus sinensis]|uniref:inactive ubiquitin thioesterase OTULINL isoform X4 n=1 Tax=Pelodiscus sinensis TaxID=13735 RepID=UPI003F6C2C56